MAARVYVGLRRLARAGSVPAVTGRVAILAGLLAIALTAAPAQGAPRLRAFDSCGALVRYADAHAAPARRVGAVPIPPTATGAPEQTTASEPAPDDVSPTNVQEAGIDEPDVVKSDGRTLFAIAQGRLQAVDVRATPSRLLGSIGLPAGGDHQLLLRGGRALVISRGQTGRSRCRARSSPARRLRPPTIMPPYRSPQTVLTRGRRPRPGRRCGSCAR